MMFTFRFFFNLYIFAKDQIKIKKKNLTCSLNLKKIRSSSLFLNYKIHTNTKMNLGLTNYDFEF